MNAEEPQPTDPTLQDGVFIGIDEGRAKLFTAAFRTKNQGDFQRRFRKTMEKDLKVRPHDANFETVTLTRKKYNAYTKLRIREKWELQRVAAREGLNQARVQLSQGSLYSCDPESWSTYLQARRAHSTVIEADYFNDKERERWRMIAFRRKKSCLDRAVGQLIEAATKTEPLDRPLIIGIGDAAFPANGPRGETAVPTSKLATAYKRAVNRERKKGRRVAVFPISENYTTKACCACGSTTEPPMVTRTWKTKNKELKTAYGKSGRLRCCKICTPIGKLRDRDVQAARNMLFASEALVNGEARPTHICAAAHKPPETSTTLDTPSGRESSAVCPCG